MNDDHIPAQDVDPSGHLVEAVTADETCDRTNGFMGAEVHRSETELTERPTTPVALLAEHDRPRTELESEEQPGQQDYGTTSNNTEPASWRFIALRSSGRPRRWATRSWRGRSCGDEGISKRSTTARVACRRPSHSSRLATRPCNGHDWGCRVCRRFAAAATQQSGRHSRAEVETRPGWRGCHDLAGQETW